MSKLARYTQKLFGSTATLNQIGQFGSLAAGTPVAYAASAITPTIIQSLSNYLTGWFGAVLGGNSPAIEDLNAICYLYAYQLSYLMQAGIAEYDSATTYYVGSFCQVSGVVYISLVDNNTGNAVTTSSWAQWGGSANQSTLSGGGTTYAMVSNDNGKTFIVNTAAAGGQIVTLPAPVKNFRVKFKDNGNAQGLGQNIVINPHSTETIDGVSQIIMTTNYGWVELLSDGTNWYVVDKSPNISPWTAWTPTVTGFGTITDLAAFYRRIGDSIEMSLVFQCGTIPSATSGTITLPAGFSCGQQGANRGGGGCVGNIMTAKTGAYQVLPSVYPGNQYIQFYGQAASNALYSGSVFTTDQFAIGFTFVTMTISSVQIQSMTNY